MNKRNQPRQIIRPTAYVYSCRTVIISATSSLAMRFVDGDGLFVLRCTSKQNSHLTVGRARWSKPVSLLLRFLRAKRPNAWPEHWLRSGWRRALILWAAAIRSIAGKALWKKRPRYY